jgi:tryptophan synthase beta chain
MTNASGTRTETSPPNSWSQWPDANGRFGTFGGRYVAETLMPLVLDLEQEYRKRQHYVGRPSPLYYAERLTRAFRRREDLFQARRAEPHGRAQDQQLHRPDPAGPRMGKTRIIAETGAGQHGVATATVCARFGLPCVVYMGATDIERQKPNVFRMKLLGAEIVPVTSGTGTLKDAMNEALRDWVTNVENTFYIIGTAAGPHPYPEWCATSSRSSARKRARRS